MYKVRFHLAAGEHFMHWQVKCGSDIRYYNPVEYQLLMNDCKLKNYRRVAQQIFDGSNKTVCAWIECANVTPINKLPCSYVNITNKITYNPRVAPFWMSNSGHDIDGYKFLQIMSNGTALFAN